MKLKEYEEISKVINALYEEMDKVNNDFSLSSGLKCVSSCGGQCCGNKAVAVSPVDLVPLALKIIKNQEAEKFLELAAIKEEEACLFWSNGQCSTYEERAVLCRLFGYSSVYNKSGAKTLSVCSFIKQEMPIPSRQEVVNQAANIVDYSTKVSNLLPHWDSTPRPFNQALSYALTKIYLTNFYEVQNISL